MEKNELENAIRELEQTTDHLLSTEFSDLLALATALEHRANAITKVALVAESETLHSAGPDAVERLATMLVRGEEATRRMFKVKQDTAEEWSRVTRARRGLESGVDTSGVVDCKG